MKRKIVYVAMMAAVGLSAAGLAQAESRQSPYNEVQMFLTAPVTLDQARQIAVKASAGSLAAIGFNNENGVGVYEASMVVKDGSVTMLKIDAKSGKVLNTASAQSLGGDLSYAQGDGEHSDGQGDGEHSDGQGNGDAGNEYHSY